MPRGVGYGLELYKHPELMTLVKEKGIAIEISPISDQAFQLVPDLQKHPVSLYEQWDSFYFRK